MSACTMNRYQTKGKIMKIKKTITIILIIIWMTTVFIFSAQPSDESATLSDGFTKTLLKILKIYPENQEKLDKIETIIRKLAHYTIYLIGGILLFTHVNLYNIITKKKIIISQTLRYNICNFRRISSNFCIWQKWRNKRCAYRFSRGINRNINNYTNNKNL